jgi:hypothetical protein
MSLDGAISIDSISAVCDANQIKSKFFNTNDFKQKNQNCSDIRACMYKRDNKRRLTQVSMFSHAK